MAISMWASGRDSLFLRGRRTVQERFRERDFFLILSFTFFRSICVIARNCDDENHDDSGQNLFYVISKMKEYET